MPIRPRASIITMNTGSDFLVSVNEIVREYDCIDFDRVEFSNVKLRTAKNSQGGDPIIVKNVAGVPIQINYTASGDVARPLLPDDGNIAAVKQRFDVVRYRIRSDLNVSTVCDLLDAQHQGTKKALDLFQMYVDIGNSMELSYAYLIGRQSTSFTYITQSALSMSGNAFGNGGAPITNLLCTELTFEPEIVVTDMNGTVQVLRSFNATLEQRTIVTRNGLT